MLWFGGSLLKTSQDIDILGICQSYFEISASFSEDNIINRDNILDAIESILENETKLIVVEAEEGMGKTALLTQFAQRHRNQSICLFIRPTSRWGYDPEVLRYDLCNQLSYILNEKELNDPNEATDMFLRNSYLRLSKQSRLSGDKIYFIIDGLEDIPKDNANIGEVILSMFYFGFPNFKFIFSGDTSMLPDSITKYVKCKSFPLTGFTLNETENFFNDLNIEKKALEEIYLNCKRIPGRLSTVKRILISGTSIEELLSSKSEHWDDLFEIEWKSIYDNDLQKKVLAVVALDNRKHTIKEISEILKEDLVVVQNLLLNLSFIRIDPSKDLEVKFVTESFRKFTAKKLISYNKLVNELIVDYLLKEPESNDSLTYLPIYLEQSGKYETLLDYLSPSHFIEMLKRSQSLNVLYQKADIGISTSKKMNRDGDLVRFSIQKSIIKELENAQIWRSEVEARMDLKEYESAISLAESTMIKEDRLHLLSIISRKMREQGLIVSTEIIEQIKEIYNEIASIIDREKSIEIASDLIYSCPDIAIDMVEKTNRGESGENELDWAFAKLTIATLAKGNSIEYSETLQSINSKIKDPGLRNLNNSVNLLVGNYTSRQIISEVEKLDNTTNKLFFLRQWLIVNYENDNSADILQYALKLAITTTAYSPNATLFRELSTPLPFIKDINEIKLLIGTFDSQKGTAESVGPTEDYIRLQLNLAHAESNFDFKACINRLVDIYLYISELHDLVIKSICLSRYVSVITVIDPEKRLEDSDGLHSMSKQELEICLNELLNTTAEHFEVSKGIIKALAKNKPEMALNIANKLNTEDRRNRAFMELIKSNLKNSIQKLDLLFLRDVLDNITDIEIKDEAITEILDRVDYEKNCIDTIIDDLIPIITIIKDIQDADIHCKACCIGYSILSKVPENKYGSLSDSLLRELEKVWGSIETGWRKVNIGYQIVSFISKSSIDKAKYYMEKTESYKNEISIDADSMAFSYISTLQLAARAYSGLLIRKFNSKNDLDRLCTLIDQIPSYGERAKIWGELALRCYKLNKIQEGKAFVIDHVKPLLQHISNIDSQYWNDLIIVLAPSLYLCHGLTAMEEISKLHPAQRDYAYYNICSYILTKHIMGNPYDDSKRNDIYVSFEEILDVCEVLSKMEDDSAIYTIISIISETIYYGKSKYTLQQRSDAINRLMSIIDSKLPCIKNIKHDGYKIVAKAQIARIKRANSAEWSKLIDEARKIDNIADRVFILCTIASLLPSSGSMNQTQILIEAKNLIEKIPSTLDKISRLKFFASLSWGISGELSRECIQSAMKYAIHGDSLEYINAQRNLIDLAYRLDPDLASSLASLVDADEARKNAKINMNKQIKINKLKTSTIENSKMGIQDINFDDFDYSKTAWKLLGSLNSGRIDTVNNDVIREYVNIIHKLPLSKSYPILAWLVENSVVRFCNSNEAQIFIRQIFESLLLGSELCLRMGERTSSIIKQSTYNLIVSEENNSILIHPGERELAIEYIKNWIDHNVNDYLKISDPFFGLEDLDILRIIRLLKPDCRVQILTSIKHQNMEKIKLPWDSEYRCYWKSRISEQNPPDTDIIIIGTESRGEPPIHDRWWITKGSGLQMGTSFNSLGLVKISDISVMDQEKAMLREQEIDQYILRQKREINGERILTTIFTL